MNKIRNRIEKFRNQVYSHNSSIDIATAQLEIDEDFKPSDLSLSK